MKHSQEGLQGRRVSLVVPVYNEAECVLRLHRTIAAALADYDADYEVIFVNDGSLDGSAALLDQLVDEDPRVRVVHFRRNFGQTAALSAGLEQSRGDIVVTMDADLQNDPHDIPAMIEKLAEGYDLVHGWRKNRQDRFWTRRLPSRIANWIIARVTGVPIHDLGCTLKVMRRQIAQDLSLYGEMHRFIAVLAHWQGAKIVEVTTTHHPRRFGQTKYGLSRTVRVILDLITVKYLIQYSNAPMRLFGAIGLGCGTCSSLIAFTVVLMKYLGGFDITGNPLSYVALLGSMMALQFFSLGILGEMSSRIYYESQGRRPYAVRSVSGQGLAIAPRLMRRAG